MDSEMKEDWKKYSPSDPELIDKFVNTIKSKGIFDQFRKDCMADVDTKPAYQNLQRRVTGTVNGFLKSQKWSSSHNKTQLRESLRKHTVKQSFLEAGVDRIVDQVVMPKIYSIFHPKVEEIVYEALGLERPKAKPKPLLDLKLDFQNFKKSLSVDTQQEYFSDRIEPPAPSRPAPTSKLDEEPLGPIVKEEDDSQTNHLDAPHTPPPLETNGEAESVHPEGNASSPASEKSASVLNNDDDSNTIDEMPLLAASMDTNSNRATTPVPSTGKNDSSIKIGNYSDSDSHSLPSSHPPIEFDSSNNMSSLKSDFKVSPSKKFDNFSNLGEKLKQSDVNFRKTNTVEAEGITEESSEMTKSSEHESESIDLNMEVQSDSNTSAMDNSRFVAAKNEIVAPSHHSDDSMSSLKSKSRSQDLKKYEGSHSNKQGSEIKSKNTITEQITEKEEKYKERPGRNPEDYKKDHSKSSSKYSNSKSRHRDGSKDKSKSHRHRDDKYRSKDGPSSESNGKRDLEKDIDEKKEKTDVDSEKKSSKQKNDSTKSMSEDSDRKKKKDEKSRHSKDDRDSKSVKKGEDRAKVDDKEKDKFKTPEKEKKGDDSSRSDRHKTKSESSSKSSHSKSGDRKSRDERKKDDRKYREDDKKKDSRKRGKCDENDSKSKNPRRSSDRDSNGNAGGGSDKTKPAGSSQTPKKSSKSEQKTRSRYKEPSNSDAVEVDDPLQVTDEVDLLLLQVNNSIENKQHRLDVREILSEPVTPAIKPKIAKNFHEIRKIMQARKNIDRVIGVDPCPSNEDPFEPLPSNAEILPSNEKEGSSADLSSHNDDDITDEEVNKIELKDFSVVVTDVLKDSSRRTLSSNWDFTSKVDVSIILGSNDEIVRVEQCCAVSETHSDENVITDSVLPTERSPGQCVPPTKEVTDEETPTDFIPSCVDVEKEVSPAKEKMPTHYLPSCVDVEKDVSTAEEKTPTDLIPSCVAVEKEVSPTEEKTSTDCIPSRVDVEEEESPIQNVREPSETSEEGKTNTVLNPMEIAEAAKVPVAVSTEPLTSGTNIIDTSIKRDDDKCSIKSERSDSSHLSQKDDVDWVETVDSDSSSHCSQMESSRKPEQVSKRNSADFIPLPSRSTSRKNAGTRMYAILEEVSSSKHYNAPADRGAKRKTSKTRSNSDAERHSSGSDTPKVAFEKGEHSSTAVEIPRSKDEGADDGSDVSNKENNETSASSTCRLKNQKVDQPVMAETRSTRKKNPGLDKPEECANHCKQPDFGKNGGIKARLSLSSKNGANEPETAIEDGGSEKTHLDVTARPPTRRSASSMSSKVKDSDERWCLKANPSSSTSKGNDSVRKSLECLQTEKENFTVVKITTSHSSESNSFHTLTLSPRRKSCPDILHPRDHCENKDPAMEKGDTACESVPGSHAETTTDVSKTDKPLKSKTVAAKLSKTNVGPQKQFEYHTRNINNRRKSISSDKRVQKQGHSSESDKSTFEEVKSEIEESDHSCNSLSVYTLAVPSDDTTVCTPSNKMFGEVATGGATRRRRRRRRRTSEVKSSESTDGNECQELKSIEGSPKSASDSKIGKPSKSTKIIDSTLAAAGEVPNSTEASKSGKDMVDSTFSEEKYVGLTNQFDVASTGDELKRESGRISKKKSPQTIPEEEQPKSVENVKEVLTGKYKSGSAFESESKLREDKKQSDELVCNPSIATERPKRKICRPSWLSEDILAPGMPPIGEGPNKSTTVIPIQTAPEDHPSHPSNESVKTGTNAEIAESKRTTDSDGKPKNKNVRSSKRVASTCEKSSVEGNENINDESASKGPASESSEIALEDSQSNMSTKNSKDECTTLKFTAEYMVEDSGSSCSLDFRGFSEEDSEPDSDAEYFGFSKGEIEQAVTQFRLLTHFIATRDSSGSKTDKTSQPQAKKVRVPSEGTGVSNAKEASSSQSVSKVAKKRKLSLSSSPEKDKKAELVDQCKAESKDSGLHESPEHPSFATYIGQKPVSEEHRTPVNGIRTKTVRTPASRPARNKTEPSSNTDIVKTRSSQSYCASDLYKPRPSFARDVRAVKRTASPAGASTLGRTRKRSR